MKGFQIVRKEEWIWIINRLSTFDESKTTGKYQFFSENRKELIDLAIQILTRYNLRTAKVPNDGYKIGKDWVLIIYDGSPRFDLKEYETETIKYRYWKSDKGTRNKFSGALSVGG